MCEDGGNWIIPFDDLEFETEIGHGSFGNVFRGSYLGTDVALKMLCKSDDPYVMNMAKREVQMLREVRHPNIMMTLGVTNHDGTVYIVAEYVPCGNLRQYIKSHRGRMTWKQKTDFCVDISKAMVYLHARNIAHRDLKAKNFLIDRDRRVKLCDFGFARNMDGGDGFATCCGTDSYVAPEIIMGMPYDIACDVFSFGVVMIEVIGEQKPENNPHFKRLSPGFGFDVSKLLDLIPADCPLELRNLAFECLLEEAEDRPTFKGVLVRLNKLSAALTDRSRGTTVDDTPLATLRMPVGPVAAAAAAAAAEANETNDSPLPPDIEPPADALPPAPKGAYAAYEGASNYVDPAALPEIPVKFSINPAECKVPVRFTWPEPGAKKVELIYKRIGKTEFQTLELPPVLQTSDQLQSPLISANSVAQGAGVPASQQAFFSASVALTSGQYVCVFVVDGHSFVYPGVLLPKGEAGIRFEVSALMDREDAPQGGLPKVSGFDTAADRKAKGARGGSPQKKGQKGASISDDEDDSDDEEGTVVFVPRPGDGGEPEADFASRLAGSPAQPEGDAASDGEHEGEDGKGGPMEFPTAGVRGSYSLIQLAGTGAAGGKKRKQKILIRVTRLVLKFDMSGAQPNTSLEFRNAYQPGRAWESVKVPPDDGVEFELELGAYEVRGDVNGRKFNLNGERLDGQGGALGCYIHVATQIQPLPVAVHNEGWLVKEGARRKSWKKRYCSLDGKSFTYYKKKEDFPNHPIDSVDISEVMGNIQVCRKTKDEKKKNMFMIPAHGRDYFFACKTTHEVLAWIQKLRISQASRISYWPFGPSV